MSRLIQARTAALQERLRAEKLENECVLLRREVDELRLRVATLQNRLDDAWESMRTQRELLARGELASVRAAREDAERWRAAAEASAPSTTAAYRRCGCEPDHSSVV